MTILVLLKSKVVCSLFRIANPLRKYQSDTKYKILFPFLLGIGSFTFMKQQKAKLMYESSKKR